MPLQEGGEKLLMGPAVFAGAFGQPGRRVPQRGCLQRPGQELQLAAHVAAGLGVRVAKQPIAPAMAPSNPRTVS